jgi:solute:Na+ symporter, SSS family
MVVGGALFFTNINAARFIGQNESVYINYMTVMAWVVTSTNFIQQLSGYLTVLTIKFIYSF